VTKVLSNISFAHICLLTFACLFSFSSCKGKKEKPDSEGLRNFKVTTMALDSAAGWGYRIYEDTTAVIEQKFIPGVPGKAGFKTEEQALKTGGLVVRKLQKGIWPPSISPEELDSLDITYQH
jgi:hypothetical protein